MAGGRQCTPTWNNTRCTECLQNSRHFKTHTRVRKMHDRRTGDSGHDTVESDCKRGAENPRQPLHRTRRISLHSPETNLHKTFRDLTRCTTLSLPRTLSSGYGCMQTRPPSAFRKRRGEPSPTQLACSTITLHWLGALRFAENAKGRVYILTTSQARTIARPPPYHHTIDALPP